ncbi:hypothetical protein P152DRAFT_471003 [Eremomyces bilateralis CBS 781.70]|uniref:Uncharacterized protein n=1 Tax=Eremomyces bilateralis CBS 781.70 TaxID=1392243 RepID=A0A6G1GCF6_9PEZI|nr:uncharacterized protein P152DRAFT_471003 [Eremomyces bilateralis CBS 781.70]KAF1815580.1 hypothetical protein P152DRAFT_471003 [Eremomyces bilateralis CBS 781.70]
MRSPFIPPSRASQQLLLHLHPSIPLRTFVSSHTRTTPNGPPKPRPHPPQKNQLKFWPFALIFLSGTGLFALIDRERRILT